MNNQMPYYGNNQGQDMNTMHFNPNMNNNIFDMIFERLNNRINRLERQVKILENRVNRLENLNPTFLKNDNKYNDNDNMYML